jgi:hypothetical protein
MGEVAAIAGHSERCPVRPDRRVGHAGAHDGQGRRVHTGVDQLDG